MKYGVIRGHLEVVLNSENEVYISLINHLYSNAVEGVQSKGKIYIHHIT